jgi:hypothetical protein
MATKTETISKQTVGAWVVHHGQKTAADINGAAEFPAIDAAAKAASLLSQLAATEELTLERKRVEALARAARLNPKTELPSLLDMLARRRLIDRGADGGIAVLGLTSRATLLHVSDIFDEQEPTSEERATITLAEISSSAPLTAPSASEYVGDNFKLARKDADELISRSEHIGFVDAEGNGTDKLIFNGNLFRRESITKVKRVLDSLSTADSAKASAVEALLVKHGCVGVEEAERILGVPLFEKLKAAGMYDLNQVANPNGEFVFVTRPAAFHKFTNPLLDDAFDLAKALVAALTYGMTQSAAGRGISQCLDK